MEWLPIEELQGADGMEKLVSLLDKEIINQGVEPGWTMAEITNQGVLPGENYKRGSGTWWKNGRGSVTSHKCDQLKIKRMNNGSLLDEEIIDQGVEPGSLVAEIIDQGVEPGENYKLGIGTWRENGRGSVTSDECEQLKIKIMINAADEI